MGLFNQLLSDPKGMLIFFLLALPGRLLAISAHEAAHGWVANRCGDPTARLMGRVTLNPLKHLDPVGVICMLLLGIGWAKPVPVNPLNYRNYRRDDLKVSLAGITMNLLLFLVGCVLLYSFVGVTLAQVPYVEPYEYVTGVVRSNYTGLDVLLDANYYYDFAECLTYPIALAEPLVAPVLGSVPSYLFQMLFYFTFTNLSLAVFNLIPVPPLDGYHVLNDLLLKRSLFADRRAQQAGMAIMYLLMFTGVLSDGLSWVDEQVFTGIGTAAMAIFRAVGLF